MKTKQTLISCLYANAFLVEAHLEQWKANINTAKAVDSLMGVREIQEAAASQEVISEALSFLCKRACMDDTEALRELHGHLRQKAKAHAQDRARARMHDLLAKAYSRWAGEVAQIPGVKS